MDLYRPTNLGDLEPGHPGTRPLLETIETWQRRRVAADLLLPRSAEQQLVELRQFARRVGPDIPVAAVTREHIEDWAGWLRTAPNPRGGHYAESTVEFKYRIVSAFFADMRARDVIGANPCSNIKRRKRTARKPRSLTPDDLIAIVRHTSNFRDRSIIVFAALTGLRRSEIARMTVEDWDRHGELLRIVSAKTRRETDCMLAGPAQDVLAAWVDHGLGGPRSGPMWPSVKGGPLKADRISEVLRDAARAAGVPATFHQLRHTFAKRMIDEGVHITVVKDLLRHESLSSTQIYAQAHQVDLFTEMSQQPPISMRVS